MTEFADEAALTEAIRDREVYGGLVVGVGGSVRRQRGQHRRDPAGVSRDGTVVDVRDASRCPPICGRPGRARPAARARRDRGGGGPGMFLRRRAAHGRRDVIPGGVGGATFAVVLHWVFGTLRLRDRCPGAGGGRQRPGRAAVGGGQRRPRPRRAAACPGRQPAVGREHAPGSSWPVPGARSGMPCPPARRAAGPLSRLLRRRPECWSMVGPGRLGRRRAGPPRPAAPQSAGHRHPERRVQGAKVFVAITARSL